MKMGTLFNNSITLFHIGLRVKSWEAGKKI
jgi:hypothetical protein